MRNLLFITMVALTLGSCNKDRFEEIEAGIELNASNALYQDATIAQLQAEIIALTSANAALTADNAALIAELEAEVDAQLADLVASDELTASQLADVVSSVDGIKSDILNHVASLQAEIAAIDTKLADAIADGDQSIIDALNEAKSELAAAIAAIPAGPAGADGANGTDGTNGTNGADGAVGATGATGAQGIQGEVGDTTTVSGTSIVGPTGAQGETGATGAQGETGATGAQGETGATGATGAAGNDGAQGPQGETGATGAAGSNGNDGAVGPAGPQGATGPQGPAGGDEADTWASNNTTTGGDVINERDGSFDNGEAAAIAANNGDTTNQYLATVTSQERLYDTTDIYDVEVLTVNGDQDDVNFPDGITRQGAKLSDGLTDQVGTPIAGTGTVLNPVYEAPVTNGPDTWAASGNFIGGETGALYPVGNPTDDRVAVLAANSGDTTSETFAITITQVMHYDISDKYIEEVLTVVDAQDDPAFAHGATRQGSLETAGSTGNVGTPSTTQGTVDNPNYDDGSSAAAVGTVTVEINSPSGADRNTFGIDSVTLDGSDVTFDSDASTFSLTTVGSYTIEVSTYNNTGTYVLVVTGDGNVTVTWNAKSGNDNFSVN